MKKKQKLFSTSQQSGFTLVELMVVMAIMLMVFSVVLVGFSRQRVTRSTTIAQNEIVTNIRKVQSFMLSSRKIGTTNEAAKFYVMHFTSAPATAGTYNIRAIDSQYDFHNNLENITINDTVQIKELRLTDKNGTTTPSCVQVLFAAPFGRMYIDSEFCDSAIKDMVKDPVELAKRGDASLEITVQHPSGTTQKKITLKGLSGRIIAE